MTLGHAIRSAFDGIEGVVLAVSGGIDSMVLLHTFAEQAPCPAVVCHVDHGLRKDSAGDATFVRSEATRLGFVFENVTIAIPSTGSIQNHARCQRRAALRGVASRYGYDSIVTAHHHDDWVETFFMNTTRGGGPQSLEQHVLYDDGTTTWIKPFSYTQKKVMREFAIANEISWREDPTNAKTDYTRNRVRAALTASVEQHGDGSLQSRLRFEETVELAASQVADSIGDVLVSCDQPWCVRLDREALLEKPPALQRALIRRAGKSLGLSVSKEAMATVLRLVHDGSRTRETVRSFVVFCEREHVTLMKNFGRGLEWFDAMTKPPRATLDRDLLWFGGDFEIVSEPPKVNALFWYPFEDELSVVGWSAGQELPTTARKSIKAVPFLRRWATAVVVRGEQPVWVPGIWRADREQTARESQRFVIWRPKQIDK